MKKLNHIIIAALVLLVAGCADDSPVGSGSAPAEGYVRLDFTVNVPEARNLTRSWNASDDDTDGNKNLLINNMQVLVFDDNGFLSRHTATSQNATPAAFTVDLPAAEKPRVLHFICNYDKWNSFPDEQMRLLNEATVLADMQVSMPAIAYWARVELPGGINASTPLTTVELMRNVAMISLVNNSRAAAAGSVDVSSYLTDVSYAIANYYDRGTVTNFNRLTGEFDGDGILEAEGAVTVPISGESDFVAAYDQSLGDPGGVSLYAYERQNSSRNLADHLFIILKGTYHLDDSDPGSVRYYKIDIVEPGAEELLDIRRNRHYVLTLGLAMNVGYGDLPSAIEGLPLNNVATSVLQSYNSISDGAALLNIAYVNKTFVNPADPSPATKDFAIRYSYIPDATTGATDNSGVQMRWGTDPGFMASVASVDPLPNRKVPITPGGSDYPPELPGFYVDEVSGKLVSSMPPASAVAQSWIRIQKNNLARTIILKLREPYSFAPVSITPSRAAARVGVEVTISFNIPAALDDQLPFPVYIKAPMLAPDISSNVYHDDSTGEYLHRYSVTHTGMHSLKFTTGSTVGAGFIYIMNEMFNDGSVYLQRQ